jgi:NTE family protein
VLKVLTRAGIPIDFLAGTSSGALIAACYANGTSPEQMEKLALQTTWRALTRLSLRKTSLLSGEQLALFLRELLRDRQFADLLVPLTVVTADLRSGTEYPITEGEVAVAVQASCSVPGIFPPVPLHDKLLVDGGVVNNVPVDVVRRMGAEIVLGVDVNEYMGEVSPLTLSNLFALIYRGHTMLMQHHVRKILHEADITIRPRTTQFSLIDLGHAREMITLGEEATVAVIAKLQTMLSADN